MDIFRKPTSGEAFIPSARQWGTFVDAARDVQTLKKKLGERPSGSPLLLPCKNATGADIPWYGVVVISGSVIDPETHEDAFKATILLEADAPPEAGDRLTRIAIAQQPIKSGQIGLVMVVGVTQVLLQHPDGASYDFAAVIDGDNSKLRLADDGTIPVIWHTSASSGDHWGLVKLDSGVATQGTSGDGGDDVASALAACADCPQGVPLPGTPTVCCDSHLQWSITMNGWITDPPDLRFEYSPDDKWVTEEFVDTEDCEGGTPNEYRLKLIPDLDPWESRIVLELVADNGCPVKCAVWRLPTPFACQCQQTFVRSAREWDNWTGVQPPCTITITPYYRAEVPELDITDAALGCSLEECLSDADPGETIDLANQLVFRLSGFDGLGCAIIAGHVDFGYRFTRDAATRCTPGQPWTYLIDADVNIVRTCDRNGASGIAWPSSGSDVFSYRLGAYVGPPAGGVCASWGSADVTGHSASAGCEPQPITTGTLVKLFRSGCDYWFEVLCQTPSSVGGVYPAYTYWYSDVGTFGGAATIADFIAWFNGARTMTLYASPPCTSGGTCNCNAAGYGVTTGTALLTTSANFAGAADEPRPPATGSGACGGCTPPNAGDDPDTDPGACCIDSECFEQIEQADCTEAGGTWLADAADCATDCEAVGACCFPGGVCQEGLSEIECQVEGGMAYYPLQSCGEGLCDVPVGACCAADHSCSLTTELECTGTWFEDQQCEGADCGCCCHPQSLGSCSGGNVCEETENVPKSYCDALTADGSFGDFTQGVACASVGCNCSAGAGNTCRVPG